MACEKCIPQTFCFCGSIDRGALVIGIIGTVLSIIALLQAVTASQQSNYVYYSAIIGAIFLLIGCVFLIVAHRTRRAAYCWPYIIFSSVSIVINIINVIASIVSLDIAAGIIAFIIVGVEIYFLLVIISFYRSLKSQVTVGSA